MKEIKLIVTDADYRYYEVMLRAKYRKDKRTGLARLVKIATLEAVLDQAQKELEEASEEAAK